MGREIKFRGINLGGSWVYGSYVYDNYLGRNAHRIDTGTGLEINVLPATVGQYTGLEDEDGIEIFEGDIVTNGMTNYVVTFYMGAWRLERNIKGDKCYKSLYRYKCKVVGNVYEKPSLLEDKHEFK